MSGKDDIRKRAETLAQDQAPDEKLGQIKDLTKLVEELQIHQIELELQNQELLKTQETLYAVQRKYQDLYNFAPVGYFTFNKNGIVLELNITGAQLLNVSRSRLIGRTLTPYLSRDSIVKFHKHCHAVLTDPHAQRKICELTMKEDENLPQYVQIESIRVESEADQSEQIWSAMVDISRQKTTETKLRASQQNWTALVNNAADPIWTVDRNFTLIKANTVFGEQFMSMTGYKLQSGQDALSFAPDDQVDQWKGYYGRAFIGEDFVVEIEHNQRVYEVSFNPIRTPESGVIGAAIIARDISDRKQMEVALRQRNKELDAFAHTVAHNLLKPLGLITGYADYLESYAAQIEAEEREKVGQKIKDLGQDASKIVDEFLFFAQVRKKQVKTEPLEMITFVRRAVTSLSFIIETKEAVLELPDDLPLVLGYAPWLKAVWINYLSNALKYGGDPPRLEIGAARQDDNMVRFWVKDNGRGLSPEARATLFTEFAHVDDPTTARGEGLGLSIVKLIIEKLGGQVGAESRAGHGSEFYFTLPAA